MEKLFNVRSFRGTVNVTPFQQKVYALCRQVPKGKVTTYKEIGKALGGKGQFYRAVGVALKLNPFAPDVPCHRVIASDGSLGGFNKGIQKKIRLLQKENIEIKKGKIELSKYSKRIKFPNILLRFYI